MDFEIIPAIDILDGKCVRLIQGKYSLVEEFSSKPEEIAKKWEDCGAKRLHVVDLNGAKEGYPANYKVITKVAKATKAKIEVGGGVRTLQVIKNYLDEGISYVVLSTKVFQDEDFFKQVLALYDEKLILGLDLKNKRLALSGWHESIVVDIDKLKEYVRGVSQIIYTDVSKDGTLSGPNLKSIKEIASSFKSKIIVSGGISSLEDINKILKLRKERYSNISGVILGKSLYKETINLSSAIKLVEED